MFRNTIQRDAAKQIVQSTLLTPLIRKNELAVLLNVSTKTIERWTKNEFLPPPFRTKAGRTIGWPEHQLEEWSVIMRR
ncbi:helix-turn-helix transcriptional regulator [Aliivibrio fischeri]|uniref:helix-turn-helix transcriptional regulator n=1 Tax=Aliivibrio fischeri TaxID=668 RepID=UPI0007C4D881|nr:hypothetical protein [Aliivibrio fischeri]MBP3141048.1 hypothetical protein [Aliivibrio fischeri]MCE7574150.1 hypothetical protein [Aliivibrio fischeri]